MQTIIITGANRGIGLELTRQYLQANQRVVATCRNPAAADALATLTSNPNVKRQLPWPVSLSFYCRLFCFSCLSIDCCF